MTSRATDSAPDSDPLDPNSGEHGAPDGSDRAAAAVDPDEVVRITQRLVRCAGANPPGDEAATAAEIAAIAAELGLEVETVEVAPGRPNVVVTLPGTGASGANAADGANAANAANAASGADGADGPALLLLGHSDVVPVGAGWTRDPFGGELADGRIYGRGATDMKGGLAATLAAMGALRRSGAHLRGPVVLLAAIDEEETGRGARHWIEHGLPRLTGLAGCLVAEPTDLQPIIAARGDSYLHVVVEGQAAHAGNPADGRNAIHGAALVVTAMERWHDDLAAAPPVLDGLVGPATLSVGTIRGGESTAMVAARCELEVDRRLLPGEDSEQMLAEARRRVADLDLAARGLTCRVELVMALPGFATDAAEPFVAHTQRALADANGPGLPPGGWSAACDGGHVAVATGAPVVVLGPGSVTGQAHRPDESVGVEELATAARCYARLACAVLTG